MSQTQTQTPFQEFQEIMISKNELEERLKEVNKLYREINVTVKKILSNLYKLQDILIREEKRTNIDVDRHCAILEELAISTIHVAYDFFYTFLVTKIKMYTGEDMYEKFGFKRKRTCYRCSRKKKRETKRKNERADVGVVIIKETVTPAMIYTDNNKVGYYIKQF